MSSMALMQDVASVSVKSGSLVPVPALVAAADALLIAAGLDLESTDTRLSPAEGSRE
jgi:hypothetical protein